MSEIQTTPLTAKSFMHSNEHALIFMDTIVIAAFKSHLYVGEDYEHPAEEHTVQLV